MAIIEGADPVIVTIAEMKANLAEVLRKAAAGEEVHVTKHGKPYILLSPDRPEQARLPRVGAFVGHEFWMADDFDELGPEWNEYLP